MMKLIQNIDVYAPQHLGKKDVLIINDKIVKIKDAGSICADGFLSEAEMINGEGLLLTPGFIDSHVHVLGGGGEGGFANRTPGSNYGRDLRSWSNNSCWLPWNRWNRS